MAVRANHETKAGTSVSRFETGAGALTLGSGPSPRIPQAAEGPETRPTREARERRAVEQGAQPVAAQRAESPAEKRPPRAGPPIAHRGKKPGRGGSEDVEHADSAKTAAPAARRPGNDVWSKSDLRNAPRIIHTPG